MPRCKKSKAAGGGLGRYDPEAGRGAPDRPTTCNSSRMPNCPKSRAAVKASSCAIPGTGGATSHCAEPLKGNDNSVLAKSSAVGGKPVLQRPARSSKAPTCAQLRSGRKLPQHPGPSTNMAKPGHTRLLIEAATPEDEGSGTSIGKSNRLLAAASGGSPARKQLRSESENPKLDMSNAEAAGPRQYKERMSRSISR